MPENSFIVFRLSHNVTITYIHAAVKDDGLVSLQTWVMPCPECFMKAYDIESSDSRYLLDFIMEQMSRLRQQALYDGRSLASWNSEHRM